MGLIWVHYHDQSLPVVAEEVLYVDHLLFLYCKVEVFHVQKTLNWNQIFTDNCNCWPYLTRVWVALYWNGISMRAASAKAVSFFDASVLSDMIFVKLTNCRREYKRGKNGIILLSINWQGLSKMESDIHYPKRVLHMGCTRSICLYFSFIYFWTSIVFLF